MGPLELVLEPPKADGSRDQSVLWQGAAFSRNGLGRWDARTGGTALKQTGLQLASLTPFP